MGRRVAYLYASASLAGAFSGLLAFAIGEASAVGSFLKLISLHAHTVSLIALFPQLKWVGRFALGVNPQ